MDMPVLEEKIDADTYVDHQSMSYCVLVGSILLLHSVSGRLERKLGCNRGSVLASSFVASVLTER